MYMNDSNYKEHCVKQASVCTILEAVVKGVAWSRLVYVQS